MMNTKYTYDYPRPAVTADCVVFAEDEQEGLSVLLIERLNDPFKGYWAFPGGFLEMGETLPEAASRELKEETGLIISAEKLKEVGCFSAVNRDPRGRVVSIAFTVLTDKAPVTGRDDARKAEWFPVSQLPPLAFDHGEILQRSLTFYKPVCGF